MKALLPAAPVNKTGKFGVGDLADISASIAEQENDRVVMAVAVVAGKVGVARGEAMDEIKLDEEIDGAVNGHGGGTGASRLGQFIDDRISADGRVGGGDDFQHLPADRGQARASIGAGRLGERQRRFHTIADGNRSMLRHGRNICVSCPKSQSRYSAASGSKSSWCSGGAGGISRWSGISSVLTRNQAA